VCVIYIIITCDYVRRIYVHLDYNTCIRYTIAAVSLMGPRLSGHRHCSSSYYIPFLIGFFFLYALSSHVRVLLGHLPRAWPETLNSSRGSSTPVLVIVVVVVVVLVVVVVIEVIVLNIVATQIALFPAYKPHHLAHVRRGRRMGGGGEAESNGSVAYGKSTR